VIRLEIQRLSGNELRDVTRDGLVTGACPGCDSEPFLVTAVPIPAGTCRAIGDTADYGSVCRACGDHVGYIRVEASTIFGREEDRAVLEHGRARVYHGRSL
jgi:hypothetical protein